MSIEERKTFFVINHVFSYMKKVSIDTKDDEEISFSSHTMIYEGNDIQARK